MSSGSESRRRADAPGGGWAAAWVRSREQRSTVAHKPPQLASPALPQQFPEQQRRAANYIRLHLLNSWRCATPPPGCQTARVRVSSSACSSFRFSPPASQCTTRCAAGVSPHATPATPGFPAHAPPDRDKPHAAGRLATARRSKPGPSARGIQPRPDFCHARDCLSRLG